MDKSIQVGDYVIRIMSTKTKEQVEYGELMNVENTLEYIKDIMQQSIESATHTTSVKYENGKLTRDGKEIKVSERISVEEYIKREAERKSKELGR